MVYPVAMIPYANMAPFREMGPPDGCCFVDMVPRQSITALKQKQVWAAAVPVGGLASLGEQVRFIGRFGIAARAEVMSVLFFSDRPFEAFRYPLALRLTGESASSVRLLYLLLGYETGFKQMPLLWETGQGPANGALQIGDAALQWGWEMEDKGSVQGYTHVTDLAGKWFERHALPFVFARWVIHRDAPQELYETLLDWLEQYKAAEQQLIQQAVPATATRLGLPREVVAHYLQVIKRCLTPEDEAGQTLFANELARFATEPLFASSSTEKAAINSTDGNHHANNRT